jgi:hypothetical protein
MLGLLPFFTQCPDVAAKEIRCLFVQEAAPGGLPPGEYGFVEYYCADPKCDCRRVVFDVFDRIREKHMAYISFGLDPDAPLRGPFLDPMKPQSKYAKEILGWVRQAVADPAYVARLERHYHMFKRAIVGKQTEPAGGDLRPSETGDRVAAAKAERKRRRALERLGKQMRGKAR